MDGVLLVLDSRTLPNLHELATVDAWAQMWPDDELWLPHSLTAAQPASFWHFHFAERRMADAKRLASRDDAAAAVRALPSTDVGTLHVVADAE
jgi:hypothetical protein